MIGKVRRIIHENILFPISLAFYYHLSISLVCQSYQNYENDYSHPVKVVKTFAKILVASVVLFVLSD